jgi:hypothetical protein
VGGNDKMSATITLNELEGRSHAILADASLTIVKVAQHSRQAIKHYNLLRSLSSITGKMEGFLVFLHTVDFINFVDIAPPENVIRVAAIVHEIPDKVNELLYEIQSTEKGYWHKLYRPVLKRLETSNRELQAHVAALSREDSPRLLLSKTDQDQLVASLLDPPEPNEALRRAFRHN